MGVKIQQRLVVLLLASTLLNMHHFFTQLYKANASEQIRSPSFAGSWYSAEPDVLNKTLERYLRQANEELSKLNIQNQVDKNILAIIAPHAGYMYSGQTAAFAYSALSKTKCKRVFVLGPSHHVAFLGAVLPSQSIIKTPLGNLTVDRPTVNKLLSLPGFQQVDQVFDTEHSLELQLPWIYKTLGKVLVIPLAIGIVDSTTIAEITRALKNELRSGDVVVVSSDFTHYGPRFDYEPFGNQDSPEVRKRIETLDKEAINYIKQLDSNDLLNFYQRTRDTICGIYPCSILLALLPPDTKVGLLKYTTSADIEKSDQQNSVSYMAIAFSAPAWTSQKKEQLTKEHTKHQSFSQTDGQVLLKIAKQVLQDYISNPQIRREPQEYISGLSPDQKERFKEQRGVFVTLYEKTDQPLKTNDGKLHKQLRGCIGYIYPAKSIFEGVYENTINAASADPRFSPVTTEELPKIELEINVLSRPTPVPFWQDIKLGEDGIVLKKAGRQAVFLPKVATEFGWDLEQTLGQLCLKAGLSIDDWRQGAEFEVFQSQGITY